MEVLSHSPKDKRVVLIARQRHGGRCDNTLLIVNQHFGPDRRRADAYFCVVPLTTVAQPESSRPLESSAPMNTCFMFPPLFPIFLTVPCVLFWEIGLASPFFRPLLRRA